MKYGMLAAFALFGALIIARLFHRNRTLTREGSPPTLLTWLSTWLFVALIVGVLAFALAQVLCMEGVLAYDRRIDDLTLAWFAVGTLAAAVLYAMDTWRRVRKPTPRPLLPPPNDEPKE